MEIRVHGRYKTEYGSRDSPWLIVQDIHSISLFYKGKFVPNYFETMNEVNKYIIGAKP